MLPAQKQETAPGNPISPPAVGFGKVLNSIQGLQQRLDDFSVEDVSGAQAKAENLIRELSLLQLKLNGLAMMEHAVTEARRTISAIPNDNFDPVNLDSLEKYPSLHVLVNASELVELVRARAQSFANYFDKLNAERESAVMITVTSDPQNIRSLPGPSSQLEASPAAAASRGVIRSLAPAETQVDIRAIAPPGVVRAPRAEDVGADLLPPMPKTEDWETQNLAATRRDKNFKTGSLVEQQLQGTIAGNQAPTTANSDFNHRLLDDLISTYGDFASSPNPSAAPKASERKSTAIHAAPLHDVTLTAASRETLAVDIAKRRAVPPKTSQAEIISPLEVQHPQPAEENITTLTKQGEIDRQLKNIIKDYGEYDLYQRHSSLNFKVAGFLVFALIGLVLGGLYFFRSPAPVVSVPANSAGQAEVKSSSNLPGHEGAGTNPVAAGRASSPATTGNVGAGETSSGTITNTKPKK
jgi:hypothetical protein